MKVHLYFAFLFNLHISPYSTYSFNKKYMFQRKFLHFSIFRALTLKEMPRV